MRKKNKIFGWVITIVMLIVGLLCIYPFIFMVSSSFKVSGDVLQKPFQIIPQLWKILRDFSTVIIIISLNGT